MPKEEKKQFAQRVLLNDEITTVKADSSIHAANQMKIKSDIARIKAMSLGLRYQQAVDNMNKGMHEQSEIQNSKEIHEQSKRTLVQEFNLSASN